MSLFVCGLTLFFGVRPVPTLPSLRSALVARLGERGCRGAFSIASATGFVPVVAGFSAARGGPPLCTPAPQAVAFAPVAMLQRVLFGAAVVPYGT